MDALIKSFKHSSQSRQTNDMLNIRLKFGWQGYGLYWGLHEHLAQEIYLMTDKKNISKTAKIYDVSADFLSEFIAYCDELYLLPKFKGKVYSLAVLEELTGLGKRINRNPKTIPILDYIKAIPPRQKTRLYNTNQALWARLRKHVFERDNYTCTYCGERGGELQCDHIIPFSKGGSDEVSNLTTSCRTCNIQKKDKSIEEFLTWKESKK